MSNKLVKIENLPENSKVFEGDVFIVPNSAINPSIVEKGFEHCCGLFYDTNIDEAKEIYGEDVVNYCIDNRLPVFKAFAIMCVLTTYGEKYLNENQIQIWVTGGGLGDNWCDHGMNSDEVKKLQFGKYKDGLFPPFIPYSFFKDKKEGDHVYLQVEGTDIIFDLTCNQSDYRYRNYGKFENVLERVCNY